MTTNLIRLPGTAEARELAEALAPTRHLHMRCDETPPGFVRGVASVDLWSSATSDPTDTERAHLEDWLSSGVKFEITDVETFGFEHLIEKVFFPLFVPAYCRREIDYSMNRSTFERLATGDAVVTLGSDGAEVVAAMLLQPASRTPLEKYSAPHLIGAGADIVAAATKSSKHRAPFFAASLEMLAANDIEQVRVRKTPWVTDAEARAWCFDAARADLIAWETRGPADCFRWQPSALSANEGLLFFQWNGAALCTRLFGARVAALEHADNLVSALLRSPNGPTTRLELEKTECRSI